MSQLSPAARQKRKLPELPRHRFWLIAIALCCVAGAIVFKLSYLQIAQGAQYAEEAQYNRQRDMALKAQRGTVFDRNGKVLASNRATFDLYVVPKECEGFEQDVCRQLQTLVGVDAQALLAKIEEHESDPFHQILVKQDVSRTDLARVEEMSHLLPGVFSVVRPKRRYTYGEVGGQLLGYLNEISRTELDRMPQYSMGDFMGRGGIEEEYQDWLHGEHGMMVLSLYNLAQPQMRTDAFGNPVTRRDNRGREVVVEDRIDPIPGRDVHLTIDIGLQRRAEEILGRERGAIVVIDADTGEVLAMASTPGYNPNVFMEEGEGYREIKRELMGIDEKGRYRGDPLMRMRSRGFQEHEPPGSVFKVMMAVAALEEGVITRDTRSWNCDGMFWLGKTSWRCHHVHGSVNVVEALTVSCDEFFYNVGLKLGVERIHEWGTKMGLGQVTGIDLPGEVPAILPTPEWKREHYAEFAPEDPGYLSPYDRAWTKGDTVNLSIGQGYCSLTPLQLAVMTACMVNGGRRVRPYINSALGPELSEPFISAETLETVREGMRLCVEKMDYPRGTGRRAYIEGLETIGKTGTAQIVPREVYAGLEDEEIPYRYRDHAWFVAGVLNMEPRIAMCVLFEHGLHGSTGAAPLAHEALEYIYRDQLDDQRRMAALDAGE